MEDSRNPYSPPTVPVEPPLPAAHLAGEVAHYEPGGARATASIVMLYIAAAVQLPSIASSVWSIVVMGRARQGGLTEADLATLGVVTLGVWIIEMLVQIGCAIAFCMWFYRVYRNLHAFGHTTARSPGWAPGSFFVPFLNLVWPFQIARETWLASAVEYEGGNALVSLWWALFLGAGIISRIGSRFSGDTPGSLQTAHVLFIVASVLWIGAAFACVKMIKGIEQRQAAHHEHMMRSEGAS